MPHPDRVTRYGTAHRRHRARLVRRYEHDGRGWPCSLCGGVMVDDPRRLHLAHDDRGGRLGLSHAACNTRAALILGNDRRAGRDNPAPTPRTRW